MPARQVALAALAGVVVQVGFYAFWQVAGRSLVGPWVLPFGRTPDDVVALVLPFLGGLVAASFAPRHWWWLGQCLAFPAMFAAHLLFAAGIEYAYARAPFLHEEGRFLLHEGHRLLAGFIGSYFGALAQREG